MTRVQDEQGAPRPLRVERLPDGRRKLLRPLKVDVSPTGDKSQFVTVCEGFCMDYSSLPWGLRWLVNWDRVDIAGVVHDYLYRTAPTFTYRSRWEADLKWFRLARSGRHCANWLQAALGLAGLHLGACWTMPARPKCTWQHKAVIAIVDLLLLGLAAWLLCKWQFWFGWMLSELWELVMTLCVGRMVLVLALLVAVVAVVNLYQSKGRSVTCEQDPRPSHPTTSEDEKD